LEIRELSLPEPYKNKSLPLEVDNSTLPYHCGLFSQVGNECGQAASVANAFTYEIDRIRSVSTDAPENRYPTHFAWNWENGGYGWYGASYYHTLKLLKTVGTPNVQTYGGDYNTGGSSRFMTGYDNYYAAMQNRISHAAAIKCDSEAGILTLKHWLHDHLDGSETGGIGFFYSQYQSGSNVLPEGTPHEGEKVITAWGASANHAMNIIGYNDSVRWDYNGDGEYTNDIDINDDGIVDVRDWEIGAFKMINNYDDPYYAWMPYRTLALESNNGGIWNQTVNVMFPVAEYTPLLTYKVNLYYSNRKRMKILTGFSTDLEAEMPDYYMSFPILDFQGGELPMQGSIGEDYKYFEFGLDVSPMLNLIDVTTPVKFFFMVLENDSWGWGSGRVIRFAVMDYSNEEPIEIVSNENDISIVNNGITTLSLIHTPQYSKPSIIQEELPEPVLFQEYSQQLEANGGTAPFRWEFHTDYNIQQILQNAPEAITPLEETYVELPFSFRFYGIDYNGFYVNHNGYIDFSGEPYSLPYNDNNASNLCVSFMHRPCIAAFMSGTSCSISHTSNDNSFVIRWIGDGIDASLALYSNGMFTIYYNNCSGLISKEWISGASNGDLEHFCKTAESGKPGSIPVAAYRFVALQCPPELQLSTDGLLTGTLTQTSPNADFAVKLTDSRGLTDIKRYSFFTDIPHKVVLIENHISIYPNPAGNCIRLNIESIDAANAVVQIYNSSGAKVLDKKCNDITNCIVNISQLAPAQYSIIVATGETIYRSTFIKEK